MTHTRVVSEHFAGALAESAFVDKTLEVLEPHGFTADNTIACVCICRDELCTPLESAVRHVWGEAFNMSSLAGVPFCGVTAFGAAHAHSPTEQDRERYAYIAMAHIGIGPGGEVGQCRRLGRSGTSKACGALAALLGEMHSQNVKLERDPDDMEQSQLRETLLQRFGWGAKPSLIELTKGARARSQELFEHMIALTVDTSGADYALFSGVQIHVPDGESLVWPAVSYAVVDGARSELTLR